jgi:hypothetical protein
MPINKSTVAICLAAAFFCACAKKAPQPAAPSETPSPNTVLARVGKYAITQDDFDRKSVLVSPDYQKFVATATGKRQFLQILIREKMIVAAASDSEVSANPLYRQQVDQMKQDLDNRLKEFQEYVLTKMWLDSLTKKGTIAVAEDEIRAYYTKYPYEISVSDIMIDSPSQATDLLRKAKAGNFAGLARQYSLDADSAKNGGKLPSFIVGEFLPELENAAAGMKPGETQGPFKTKTGYHILHKNGENHLSYGQAHDRIAMLLEKKKLDDYLNSMKSKYPVEVLDANYKYE